MSLSQDAFSTASGILCVYFLVLSKFDPTSSVDFSEVLGVTRWEALMVDGREINFQAAEAEGISSIRLQLVQQLRANIDVVDIGILPTRFQQAAMFRS